MISSIIRYFTTPVLILKKTSLIKKDLDHFWDMAKEEIVTTYDVKEFWEYVISFAEMKIAYINREIVKK